MSHVAQPRLVSFTFLEEPRLRGCGRSMGIVTAFLTSEVYEEILLAAFGRLARTIPGYKALLGSHSQRTEYRIQNTEIRKPSDPCPLIPDPQAVDSDSRLCIINIPNPYVL
jgi:hypothetical protein